MSIEIVNAKSSPSSNGPPHYLDQSRRYNKSATTIAQQEAFLKGYIKHGTISHAAKEAGVSPGYHHRWLEVDPEYPARFKEAYSEAVDHLEREARRRAIEGVEEPTGWYKGEPGGFVKKYSDTLLIFLLKGALPDKYKDRHEHTGKNGGPIEVQSTVTIEQFPVWLKQAIVVISSGMQIDSEVEQVLMSHFEAKFLEAEKLVGNGVTEGQRQLQGAESYQGEQLSYHRESIPIEGIVEVVAESGSGSGMEQGARGDSEPVLSRPDTDRSDGNKDYRPTKRQKTILDMDDI